jgi:predicted Zn-dependent protease
MADMQNRQRTLPYKQRVDSIDFHLVKARLKALANLSVDGLRQTRVSFEQQLKQKTTSNLAATWYGYAVTLVEQRDWLAAEKALQETQAALKTMKREATHPFLSILSAEIKLRTNDPAGALSITTAAIKIFPTSRALMYEHIRALQANGQHAPALQLLGKERDTYKRDARLYSLSAESYAALNQRTAQHQMTGEYYVLIGALPAALEQFNLARLARDGDFYLNSIVDARFRELQERIQDEKSAR